MHKTIKKCIATFLHIRATVALTHSCSDDRQSQVIGVQDVGHEQEVHVTAVTGQQNHGMLLDGLLELTTHIRNTLVQ